MEGTAGMKKKTARGNKREVHCSICGSVAGKSGPGGAAFRCPRCKADIEVELEEKMMITRTSLRDA